MNVQQMIQDRLTQSLQRKAPANAGPPANGGFDPQIAWTVRAGSPLTSSPAALGSVPTYQPAVNQPPPYRSGGGGISGALGPIGPLVLVGAAISAVQTFSASASAGKKVEDAVKALPKIEDIMAPTLTDIVGQIKVLRPAVQNLAVIEQQTNESLKTFTLINTLFGGMLDQLLSGDLFGAQNSAIMVLILLMILSRDGVGGWLGGIFGGGIRTS